MAKEEKSAAEIYRQERKARLAKAAKKNNKKAYNPQAGKTAGKIISVILVVAIIAGVTALAVNLTGAVEKNRTAVTVGDVVVNQPEFSYYYSSGYQMVSNYYASYVGYDTSKAPSSQTYAGAMGEIPDFPEDKTPTWSDFFKYYAENNLKYIKAFVKIANEKNITLDDSDKAKIDENIESITETAKNSGYSLNSYLRAVYGKGVNEKLLRTILEEQTLAQKVESEKTEELKASYTDKQVEKEYNKNTQDYATVSYRAYKFAAEKVKSEDGSSEAVNETTLAAAKKKADAFAKAVTDENSFKALAADEEKSLKNSDYKLYITDDSKTLSEEMTYSALSQSASDSDFLEWAFNAKTAKGDTYVLKGTEDYTVYMMTSPMHKAADTVTYDVRHILVKFPEAQESSSEGETAAEGDETTAAAETTAKAETADEKKTEDVKVETLDVSKYKDVNIYLDVNAETAKDKATYKKAQDILEEYLKGDRTEEAFEALEKEYSEDTRDDDGHLQSLIYENVPKGQMVPEFESWSLAKGRKAGDVGIVETTYGDHIMYFVKTTTTTWEDTVRAALAQTDLSTYQNEVVESDNVKLSNENDKAICDVTDFIDKLAKQAARNQSSQLSY